MRTPLICATVTARTMEELRLARDSACDADMVEVRLDGVRNPDADGALQGRRKPVLVTCRPVWEGGAFDGAEEERHRLLHAAAAAGAEYVDVEAAAPFASELIRARGGRGIVLSAHGFEAPPRDVRSRFDSMRRAGTEVVKIALTVDRLSDTQPFFDLGHEPEDGAPGHVVIAMGSCGVVTRVLAARLHNRWTYAGDGIAPGQLPADRLLRDFRFRRITPDVALYGITGRPVGHSRSPVMHNAGFAALGLNAAYVPLEARDVDDFAAFARGVGVRGASVTAPFKVDLIRHLDELTPLARRAGAVNTLIVREGRWIGANTDVDGVKAPLLGRIRLRGLRASILGSGGAARAAAVALADEGAAITVCARRVDQARQIAEVVEGSVGVFPPAPGSWDLLVNATPIGSAEQPVSPMGSARLTGDIVFDLVYAPAETQLLADARAAGCLAIGGIEMLIAQAERQFELWTGQRPPAGLFDAAQQGAG